MASSLDVVTGSPGKNCPQRRQQLSYGGSAMARHKARTAAKFPGEIIDQEKVESPRNKDSGSSPVKHCWQILLGRNF